VARHSPPNLRRKTRAVKEPRLAITIYCEGGNTEPDYFRRFAQEHGNRLVEVEIIGPAGVPMTLVKKAVEEAKRRRRKQRNSFEERDQIWVAFDADEHPHVPEAIRMAEEHNVSVAFSNPCFELWGIVHLVDYEFNKPLHRHEAQRLLKTLMPKYDPHGSKVFDYPLLSPRYEAACKQAANMDRCRIEESSPAGNPFTSVHLLAKLIVASGKPPA